MISTACRCLHIYWPFFLSPQSISRTKGHATNAYDKTYAARRLANTLESPLRPFTFRNSRG